MRRRISIIILSVSGILYAQQEPVATAKEATVATTDTVPTTVPASEASAVTPAPVVAAVTEPVAPPVVTATPEVVPSEPKEPVVDTSSMPAPEVPVVQEAPGIPAPAEVAQPVANVEETPANVPVSEPQPTPVEEPKLPMPEEQEAAKESVDEEEISSIDTVDINEPQGNWLYKRVWWEKAERLYEKIKRLADQIAEMRAHFFNRRNDLDRNILDPFYLHVGLDQGELQQTLAYFAEQLQGERKEMGSLNAQERELLSRVNEERKTLEQLTALVQAVSNVDHALDDALLKLVEQINLARDYEKRAWENFKSINRQLSDKAARELYYGMDNSWRNLNNINSYLTDAFGKHFEQLSQKIDQDTDNIKTIVRALKEKGIDLKAQAQRLLKPSTCQKQEKEEVVQEEQGWLGWIWGMATAPFVYVWHGITAPFVWVASWFIGNIETVEVAHPNRAEGAATVKEKAGKL